MSQFLNVCANGINDFIVNANAIADEIQTGFSGLSVEQLNWKPNDTSWSIAQCVEHLIITNNLYFQNIQKVADGTHSNNIFSMIPVIPLITGSLMKKLLGPDSFKKVKTFAMFKPSQSDISDDVLEKFAENQYRFINLMEQTKNLDVRKIKVAEPIGSAVNLRLVDAFEVLVVHEKRHLLQAKRVLGTAGFPK